MNYRSVVSLQRDNRACRACADAGFSIESLPVLEGHGGQCAYPGRVHSRPGDRPPTAREQELCGFWLDWELRLLRPALIVAVGGLAIGRLVGRRSLDECIGMAFEHDGAVVVPLPHPSGVSRWPNVPANRTRLDAALALIRARL